MDVDGYVEPGFEPVREVFAEVLAGQAGTGAAAAAWRDGRWVADLWGGPASADGAQRWQADSRRATTNPPGAFDPVVVNGPAWRAAEVRTGAVPPVPWPVR